MSKLIERFIGQTAIGTFDASAHQKRLIDARGADVFKFVDDFVRSRSAAADAITGATVTLVEAGAGETTVAYADVVGGVLRISADANDNDGANVQFAPEAFKLAAGFKYFYFGCRVKISEATQSDLFIGLAVTDTDLLGGVTDSIGFRKVDGETTLSVLVEKDSTETLVTAAANIGTAYRFLELVHDGTSLEAFVDGVSVGFIATTNLPNDEELRVSVHALAGAAAASVVCDVDLIRVIQIGGRAA
jgi:hypothetical protein